MRESTKIGRTVLCFTVALILTMGCTKENNQNTDGLYTTGLTSEDAKDFVYVPAYQQITDEVSSRLSCCVLSGDYLYYIETVTGESPGIQLVCKSLTTQEEPVMIPLELSENEFPQLMKLDKNGNFLILVQAYDQDLEKNVFQVVTLDQTGKELSLLDISAQVNADPLNAYVQHISLDEAGRLYLSGGQSIWLYDEAGEYADTIAVPGTILNMGIGKDGKVYISYLAAPTQWLAEIDFDSRSLGMTYDNFPSYSSGILTSGADGDFLLNEESGLTEYDLASRTGTKILDWADSNLSSQFFRQVCMLTDGRIAALNLILGENRDVMELVILTKTPVSELPDKEEIVVGSVAYTSELKQQAAAFNAKSEKYKVVVKSYMDESVQWTREGFDEAMLRMNLEIASNHAPDMLVIPSDEGDWETYVDKNVFADLTPFFESSKTLKIEDMVDSVVRAFTYDNQLIGLPVGFHIRTLIGKTSVVGEREGWTPEEFEAFIEANPDRIILPGIPKDYLLSECLSYSIDNYIDWEKGVSYFDGDAFKEMLQLLHHIPDAVDADADLFIDQGEEAPLLSYYVLYGIRDYQLASVRAHEPVTFIGFPTLEGKNGHGISSWRGVYSILEQSRHKEGAWEFMEYIFAMDMMDYGGITDHLVIPVKKSELEKFIAEVTAPDYQLDKNGDPLIGSDGEILRIRKGAINYPGEDPAEYYAATPEEIEGLRTLIDSAGRVVSNNDTVMKIVQEEAKGYFDDQKTLDEVANIIQNRVQIYMSENR